jgi:hypothetical protein
MRIWVTIAGGRVRERHAPTGPGAQCDSSNVMQNPVKLLARALVLWLQGRVRFERDLDQIKIEDQGETFCAFRKVRVAPKKQRSSAPGAIFRVRFRFRNLSQTANRLLSCIPIPLIVAQPGLLSKTWLLGESSGEFMGYYEFETEATARAYWDSLPLEMMRRRAEPGSLSHEVIVGDLAVPLSRMPRGE